MSVKQNAHDFENEFPLAAKVVEENVYVDDCLTGADNAEEAICLQRQLLNLFRRGNFFLRKWNSSEPSVLKVIDPTLRDSHEVLSISETGNYTKTLGLEWNAVLDHFRLAISSPSYQEGTCMTKRMLISNIAKIFDILGWFSPTIIKVKILLQKLWQTKLEWDDPIPTHIQEVWQRWESELQVLSECHVPRYYFPKDVSIINVQLHGFSDASEDAYAAAVYVRGKESNGTVHVSLIMAKTRVSPLKRLTIPRLELCGAYLLSQLLDHVKSIYQIPIADVYAWTDSTIVLNWLSECSRKFKTFVGNRVSNIIDVIPPSRWSHVRSQDNPTDCASRGLYPNELPNHHLWWNGPDWLKASESKWPTSALQPNDPSDEQSELCSVATMNPINPIIPLTNYSSFKRLQRVTAWILRFITNCRTERESVVRTPFLNTMELARSEKYWLTVSQMSTFPKEISTLNSKGDLPANSSLLSLRPFIDPDGLMRVGGRISKSKLKYDVIHPVILHGSHLITKLLIHYEHHRLLHAGPTLVCSSISLRFHIINLRKTVQTITRACITCRRHAAKPLTQLQGQLPPERVTPDSVFSRVGVDYAGPLNIKYGYVRKPTIVKAYVCVFVSLSIKAVHLELVSDLTTQSYIAALRRFIARRGYPSLIWSDNGTNFVGASNELNKMNHFLSHPHNNKKIIEFCASEQIEWRFVPERSPHFGGLWEAAVKSMKTRLRRIVNDNVKLTFEEMSTVISQIESCLNSRPLIPLSHTNDEGTSDVTVLTPGHFLIGCPLMALPDLTDPNRSISSLRRWDLCQALVRHFWDTWSKEYIITLNKLTKWTNRSRNAQVGDIVLLKDETLFPTRWPLARITEVHPGKDDLVRVVTLKTEKGTYKRPITKIVVLIPQTNDSPHN